MEVFLDRSDESCSLPLVCKANTGYLEGHKDTEMIRPFCLSVESSQVRYCTKAWFSTPPVTANPNRN